MMIKTSRLSLVVEVVIIFAVVSCADNSAIVRLRAQGSANAIIQNGDFYRYSGEGLENLQVVTSGDPESEEAIYALSGCHCGADLARDVLQTRAESRRTLPQVLVPRIRKEIQENPLLAALDQLPFGLGSLIAAIAANDEKMAVQIRDGIKKNMATSLTALGGSPFVNTSPFRFDLFHSSAAKNGGTPQSFAVSHVANYWNLIFGADQLWQIGNSKGDQPHIAIGQVDAGAQALELTRTFAEWTYILGIGSDGNPNGMGGLAFDVSAGHSGVDFAVPANPNQIPEDQARFITGDYAITYPTNQSTVQTSKVKETWSASSGKISLGEQAQVWRAAALAFGRMRSDRVGAARALYSGTDSPMTNNSRALPLIWLPGMKHFLESEFINKDTQKIFEFTDDQIQEASLDSLVKLGFALAEWIRAVKNIEQTDLTDDMKGKLVGVDAKLKDPLRLALVTILKRFTEIENVDGKQRLVFNDEALGASQMNAAVALLLSTEQSIMSGGILKSRAMSLFHGVVAKSVESSNSKLSLDLAAVAWLSYSCSLVQKYDDAPQWVQLLQTKVDASLQVVMP